MTRSHGQAGIRTTHRSVGDGKEWGDREARHRKSCRKCHKKRLLAEAESGGTKKVLGRKGYYK